MNAPSTPRPRNGLASYLGKVRERVAVAETKIEAVEGFEGEVKDWGQLLTLVRPAF